MRNKSFLGIIVVIALVVIGGIYYSKTRTVPASKTADVKSQAVEKNNPKLCDKLPTTPELAPNGKNNCLYAVARAHNNPAACESYKVNGSSDGCYAQLARDLTSSFMCDKIQSDLVKGLCYGYFAQTNKSVEACNSLSTPDAHNACVASYASSASNVNLAFCEKNYTEGGSPNFKNGCYTIVASLTKSAAVCAKITGPDAAILKDECQQAAR